MKQQKLIRALFTPRRKDPVDGYIKSIPTIDKLIADDLLYIDPRRPYITLSLQLHLAYADDEVRLATFPHSMLLRMGLVERDARYRALMDHLLAYINFHRARLGLALYPPQQRLDFLVMNLDKTQPLLVGCYQDGRLDYRAITDAPSGVAEKKK